MRRWLVVFTAVGLMLVQSLLPVGAAPNIGRLGILTDVPGYDTGHGVLVPLRGVAEWCGARVSYKKPNVEVTLRETTLQLTIGSPRAWINGIAVNLSAPAKEYGGMLCVPLRFVAENLFATVDYIPGRSGNTLSDEMANIPFVSLQFRGKLARVLVHKVRPDSIQGIIRACAATTEGAFGRDWIIGGYRQLGHGYVWTTDPYGWEGSGFLSEGDNGVLWAYSGGSWREKGYLGLDSEWANELRANGVPQSVIVELKARL